MFLFWLMALVPSDADSIPPIQSMSVLEFMDDGTLLIGDSIGARVFAVDLGEQPDGSAVDRLAVSDLESKLAQLLGCQPQDVLVHDMAVHPRSREVYLSVSRGRSAWNSRWELPNDLANSKILLKMSADGVFSEVNLKKASLTHASISNPIDQESEHRWKKGIKRRVDAITDITFHNGTVYVAGLSNEEFASAIWKLNYPFAGESQITTVEIFHGAHGKYETHAPIRAFVPYQIKAKDHMLAAYLCTPFVTFELDALKPASHVKGRTIGEFGSGNYPLDMIVVEASEGPRIMIANSNLPLMFVDPADIEAFEGEINQELDTYLAGVPYEFRSGMGILQLDNLGSTGVVALQRLPSGKLDLVSFATKR